MYPQALGAILIGVGGWALDEKTKYSDLSSVTFNPAVLLIIVGALMFIIAFCGCVGALRENKLLLQMVRNWFLFYPLVTLICWF